MPISYSLCENGHIEHIVVADPWTLNDLKELYAKRKSVFERSTHTIHVFVDLSNVATIPLGAISLACKAQFERHPRLGSMALIGCSRMLRGVAETILHLAHYDRVGFFETESEAWGFLYRKLGSFATVG